MADVDSLSAQEVSEEPVAAPKRRRGCCFLLSVVSPFITLTYDGNFSLNEGAKSLLTSTSLILIFSRIKFEIKE